jgi:hypothetical protein
LKNLRQPSWQSMNMKERKVGSLSLSLFVASQRGRFFTLQAIPFGYLLTRVHSILKEEARLAMWYAVLGERTPAENSHFSSKGSLELPSGESVEVTDTVRVYDDGIVLRLATDSSHADPMNLLKEGTKVRAIVNRELRQAGMQRLSLSLSLSSFSISLTFCSRKASHRNAPLTCRSPRSPRPIHSTGRYAKEVQKSHQMACSRWHKGLWCHQMSFASTSRTASR